MTAIGELRRQFQQLPPEMTELLDAAEEEMWNAGFNAASEELVRLRKRLTVLELLCAGAAWRGQDAKFHQRWQWYRNLPMAGDIPADEAEELRKDINE